MSNNFVSIRQYRRDWWAKAIVQCKRDCKEKNITVQQWCDEHEVSIKRYWYYHKVLGDQAAQSIDVSDAQLPVLPESHMPTFVELKDNDSVSAKASIQVGVMTIILDESISDKFLQRIMKAASNV